MLDKNGNPTVTGGCLRTVGDNPCNYRWTYLYEDRAGNTNTFYVDFTVDYQGFNTCS